MDSEREEGEGGDVVVGENPHLVPQVSLEKSERCFPEKSCRAAEKNQQKEDRLIHPPGSTRPCSAIPLLLLKGETSAGICHREPLEESPS